ncbi:MAG: hypothetical protein K9L74_05690 [Candidatus Izimaplasma sp.]|nr:hypothetical protein [Candidatus Izimaplasma bacterium]
MTDFTQYQELAETGVSAGKKQVDPKDEVFKSLYIAGLLREDETSGEQTQPGKLQIRGLANNLDKVCFIITHVKNVLVNEKKDQFNPKQNKMVCFSYQSGPRPWYGTSGKMCGNNSNERKADEFCSTCRSQIIVAGVYCNENGQPFLNDNNKPEFIFIRGKGMKFKNVSDYIHELSQLELDRFFDDDSDEAKRFEKMVVNNKRFVTEASVTTADSNYGKKYVFKLEKGKEIDKSTTEKILSLSKKILEEFNEKFDWSRNTEGMPNYGVQEQAQTSQAQEFSDPAPNTNKENETKNEEKKQGGEEKKKVVSFDDIDF